MFRRTKIVATLGPATDDPKVMNKMIEAGVDVIRLNFSHGAASLHARRAQMARGAARAHQRQGGGLSAKALTDKDRDDIKHAAALEADYLAISFPRSAADIHEARELFRAAGGRGGIVAKIERAEAVEAIAEIAQAADVVMIARGDLAVEIGDADVPPIQKRIIRVARRMNKIVITATQMMESMVENAIPTRAE